MLKPIMGLAFMALSACAQAEPRSVQYFEAHLDEAKKVAADCLQGSATGEECTHAGLAIKVDEDRKRFERFRGK